jgi:hypothetical protein
MDDHPPIARLIKAQVLFDTTVPRYFAVINECPVLREAFPRALITTGVELELAKARRPVAASGGDLGGLLDDPPWAQVVELTGLQIIDVEQLRLAFHSPQELLEKETTDLGEFETIVASQARGGLPIVMEDSNGARIGRGRGLACYQAIHVCMMIAIRQLLSVEASWTLYGRLLAAGLRPRNPDRVGFGDATRGDYFEMVEAALEALVRGTAKRRLGR